MNLPMPDTDVAQRVFDHIANGTTDMGAEVWHEPVANYRSTSRLEREVEHVLRRRSIAFCPSAALLEPGAYLAREAAGVPIVAVRGRDGVVRAFRNVCRHRGMRLAEGSGCANAFVCGYHGWAYGLDGALKAVPHEHGFPGLDKSTHGLVPVATTEHGGLVFVNQSGEGDSIDDLPLVLRPDQRLLSSIERDIDCNWKLLLEGFIEGYHIQATHPQSFLPYGFDNLNVVETFGRNSRVTYPFKRIAKLATVPPAERKVAGLLTYVYQLFPNVLVTVLSRHTNLVVLEPLAVDRTRQFTYTLTNGGGDDEEEIALAKRNAAFVGNTGGNEDRAVVCAIQRGLGSGANEFFTFGRFEAAIAHFHRQLGEAFSVGAAGAG